MIRDARDVAHSTSSALAIQQYETALEQFHSYRGDVLATLDAALAADPSFVRPFCSRRSPSSRCRRRSTCPTSPRRSMRRVPMRPS